MAQNIDWLGNQYANVPFVDLPKTGGGFALFSDPSITTAVESDVASGKQFLLADGSIGTGTASGGGGTDRLVLLKTIPLGTISTTATSATSLDKSLTIDKVDYNAYDLLLVDVSVDTPVNGRHTSTVCIVGLIGTNNVDTKNGVALVTNKWSSRLSSSGTPITRQSTTAYGVYVYSATRDATSPYTITMPLYARVSSTYSGNIDNDYTARIYGIRLIDLIGG